MSPTRSPLSHPGGADKERDPWEVNIKTHREDTKYLRSIKLGGGGGGGGKRRNYLECQQLHDQIEMDKDFFSFRILEMCPKEALTKNETIGR